MRQYPRKEKILQKNNKKIKGKPGKTELKLSVREDKSFVINELSGSPMVAYRIPPKVICPFFLFSDQISIVNAQIRFFFDYHIFGIRKICVFAEEILE